MAELKGVEVFDTGTNNGVPFKDPDLDEMVRGFVEQRQAGKLPVKIGHTEDDTAPAMGWIQNLYKKGSKLLADLSQVPDELVERIKEGRWRHVSVELLKDVTTRDGKRYDWLLDGLAILGAARPAVESLAGLHTLFQRGTPGVRFAERLAFTRAGDDTLAAQVATLQRRLLEQQQQFDIRSGRVLPAEAVRFDRRYRDDPTGKTIESWNLWVKDAPPVPAAYRREATVGGRVADTDGLPAGATPDVELVVLTKAEIERSGGRLSYAEANRIVMRREPELTERYRLQPGVMDR